MPRPAPLEMVASIVWSVPLPQGNPRCLWPHGSILALRGGGSEPPRHKSLRNSRHIITRNYSKPQERFLRLKVIWRAHTNVRQGRLCDAAGKTNRRKLSYAALCENNGENMPCSMNWGGNCSGATEKSLPLKLLSLHDLQLTFEGESV